MRHNRKQYVAALIASMALAVLASGAAAQGRDQKRPNDDHGQRADDRGKHDEKSDYHFRSEDRDRFSSHYQSNIKQMQKHPDKRHHVRPGEHLPSDYRSRLKSVPASYYRNMPPPPPGYRFGYYDGYVVAYNPTTQIIADVLDLVDSAVHH